MSGIRIGIDPGMSGAIAALIGTTHEVMDMPVLKVVTSHRRSRLTNKVVEKHRTEINIPAILERLRYYRELDTDVQAWLENVHSMPEQGVRSMFSMGEGLGILKCALTAVNIPWTLLDSRTWKKQMMMGMGKEKEASVYRALQIWPDAILIGPKGGKKDGRADALLIARYGQLYTTHDKATQEE